MTFLITTGGDLAALQTVDSTLHDAGMAVARPSQRDEQWTLERWHQAVLAQQPDDAASLEQPGRLWEQLAVDLVLANMQAECWGWTSPDAVRLLDFWASFEPQTRFVLLCEPLEQALSRFITSDAPLESLVDAIGRWQDIHQALLRFHLRHASTSTLLWGTEATAYPTALTAHLASALGIESLATVQAPTHDAQVRHPEDNPLRAFVADRLTRAFPEACALAHELVASVRPLAETGGTEEAAGPVTAPVGDSPDLALGLLRGYREERQHHDRRLIQLQTDLCRELDAQKVARAHAESQEQETRKKAEEAAARFKETAQQNELLLAQLHQVQEELERAFLAHAQSKEQLEAESSTRAELTQQKDAEATARSTAVAERDAARKELDAQKAARAMVESELEALRKEFAAQHATLTEHQKQLTASQSALEASTHAVRAATAESGKLAAEKAAEATARSTAVAERDAARKELDAQKAARAKVESELEALRKEFAAQQATLTEHQTQLAASQSALEASTHAVQTATAEGAKLAAEKAAEATARATAIAERDAARKDLDAQAAERSKAESQAQEARKKADEAAARLEDAIHENDLLLAQLHQVQEELERYFLEHGAARAAVQALDERFTRVLGALPGAFDCEALTLLQSPEDGEWEWQGRDIRVAGRTVEWLRYGTRLEQGTAVLALSRDGAPGGALLRWPLSAKDATSITLAALADPQGGTTYLSHLAQLTTSDWTMMRGLLTHMFRQLARGALLVSPAQANDQLPALGRAMALMDQLPALLRFDDAKLTGHTSNAQREVLGLRLSNVSFGKVRVPELNLQFQAEVQPAEASGAVTLGGMVCLIFGRETAADPFETWASNATDASDKLVMAIPATSQGPSQEPWARLTAADQAFLVSLCDALPLCLATLRAQASQVKRPLKEWAALASEMGRRLRMTPVSEVQPDKTPSALEGEPPALERAEKAPARKRKARQPLAMASGGAARGLIASKEPARAKSVPDASAKATQTKQNTRAKPVAPVKAPPKSAGKSAEAAKPPKKTLAAASSSPIGRVVRSTPPTAQKRKVKSGSAR